MTSRNKLFNTFPVWDARQFDKILDEIFPEFQSHSIEPSKGRPINRGYLKDEKGNITNIVLETVYTPFKKEDVSVQVCDDVLEIKMGTDSEKTDNLSNGEVEYDVKTISQKSVELKFKLLGEIDKDRVEAEAVDGVLKINLPIKEEEIPTTKQITVK